MAFGVEDFDEGSKLHQVAMYSQKSSKKWWSSLKMLGKSCKTWKTYQKAIMAQFIIEHVQGDVLVEWRDLHLDKGEHTNKYINMF